MIRGVGTLHVVRAEKVARYRMDDFTVAAIPIIQKNTGNPTSRHCYPLRYFVSLPDGAIKISHVW